MRFEEPHGPKPPPAEARNSRCFRPRRLRPRKQSLIHYLFSKAGRTPGRNGNSRRASGGLRPYAGGGSGPRDPKGSQKLSQQFAPILSGSACRPSPRGAPRLGDEAGDLKVAKIPAPAPPQFCQVRAARSPGGPNGPARRPGAPTGRKNNDLFTAPRFARFVLGASPLAPVPSGTPIGQPLPQ